MAAVTYATRLPLWFLARRRVTPHPRLARVLAQIPIAAFAAIVFPGVLQPGGSTELEASNLYLYAAVVTVAAAVAARGRLLPAIVLGVGTAGLLRAVVG
ncbi:MAG: AzlD domain-containing protein [Solirubrobacterales bacterium]|nr:AzlD domain-containing protein [Solirubrobacterales bacterium]